MDRLGNTEKDEDRWGKTDRAGDGETPDSPMDMFRDPLLIEVRKGDDPSLRINLARRASSEPRRVARCRLVRVDRKYTAAMRKSSKVPMSR